MCGIVGVINRNASEIIKESNSLILHRGPDDEGYFVEDGIALAHRRLSIQDTSKNGHQPMISSDGNYIIVFNGEIYNHWEIREKLLSKYTFKSNSDTETLLYGFIEFGKKILSELNGIFAFCIYNRETKELFIARDHFGVKPLYYYVDDNLFWFSSEIKTILPLDFNRELDYQSLENYLTFLYSPGVKTPFKHIKKLLPGHSISVFKEKPKSMVIEKYYDIPFDGSRFDISENDLINELDERLTKAVERQMLSDVPVGFFLSGGLDSSGLVAIARKLYPERKLRCYTIKTNDGEDLEEGFVNDLYYARLVANHLGVDLAEVESNVDIVEDFDKMIFHLDEPQADPAPLNVYAICKQAREDGIIVLLGGTAGDDLFSGYRRHQALNIEKYLRFTPMVIRRALKSVVNALPGNSAIIRRLKKLTGNIHLSQLERMKGYFSWIEETKRKSLFSSKVALEVKQYNPLDSLGDYLKNIPKEMDPLNQMLYWEMKFFLVDHNLNYTDKMSMATGVEVRVPFLDKELVEFSLKIPTNLKMNGVTTKYILKKVMERYLPKEVIYRPKSGFGSPIRSWIVNDMDKMINDSLSSSKINSRGIFDPLMIKKLIIDNKKGKIDASYTIWSLLSIESWMRQFYDRK